MTLSGIRPDARAFPGCDIAVLPEQIAEKFPVQIIERIAMRPEVEERFMFFSCFRSNDPPRPRDGHGWRKGVIIFLKGDYSKAKNYFFPKTEPMPTNPPSAARTRPVGSGDFGVGETGIA